VGQNPQVRAMRRGVDILIATPGRLLDLQQQGHVALDRVEILVLDEADRLLDMGFVRDVRKLVAMTPSKRQSLLFSATMPKAVDALAREILNRPQRVEISPEELTVDRIDQHAVWVPTARKREVLIGLLEGGTVGKAVVFTRTKYGAEKLARQLKKADVAAEAIHGNKSQNARTRALDSFKQNKTWVLVATDVASRGIDIDGITHVFNFELPHEPESYVHRIGRTARAGADGTAWSLVDSSERKRLVAIERFIKQKVPMVDVNTLDLDLPDLEASPVEMQGQAQASKTPSGQQSRAERGDSSPRKKRRRRRRRGRGGNSQAA